MKLSIVATLYQSAAHLEEFYKRASKVAHDLVGEEYEIILVDDGSPDNSLDLAVKLAENNEHVVVVELSRNFGHHKAIMTGLAHTCGENIFLIDSDLEEEPELLSSFFEHLTKENCDVVYGVQKQRKGAFLERISGHFFYKFFNFVSGISLPENMATVRLMSRQYVSALLEHEEREIFLGGLFHITGFNQQPKEINKLASSKSTYTFRRKMSLFVNSITSFSNAPLIGIFYIGICILFFAGVYTSYLIFQWIFFSKTLMGWTSIIASIWILGGLIISFIGIIGIYISKVFSETKCRPYTIIKAIYRARDK